MNTNDLVLNEYCIKHTCRGCKFALLCEQKQIEEDIEKYKRKKGENYEGNNQERILRFNTKKNSKNKRDIRH